MKEGTSETLCYEISKERSEFDNNDIEFTNVHSIENIREISEYVPKHSKPNDLEFGHYLAGLIEGDGHFSLQKQLIITFNSKDISLAYFIKSKLGFGTVKQVSLGQTSEREPSHLSVRRNAVLFVLSNKQGILTVLNLINGKMKTQIKLDQIVNNILPYYTFEFNKNLNSDFNNYWLAGFSDADASFQIKIIQRVKDKKEVRLNFQIDQKHQDLLLKVREELGGNIGYRKSQDIYYYGSTSFGSARKVINYFDHYNLQSTKYLHYLKWRKAYLILQNKDFINEIGLNKIIKLSKGM